NYRYHHGMFLLSTGAFDEGWADHEWRLEDAGDRGGGRVLQAPRGGGGELNGKRIHVVREQGGGGSGQVARSIAQLASRGAAVTFLVLKPLATLIRRSFPGVDVTDAMGVRAPYNYQLPVLSLPYALRITGNDLPGPVPYLFPDPARVDAWRGRVGS